MIPPSRIYPSPYDDLSSDSSSDDNIITRPSELSIQFNNHLSEFNTDSDNSDTNNIISIERRKTSFIKKSLKKFSHRVHNSHVHPSLKIKDRSNSFLLYLSNCLYCKINNK